MKLIPGMLTARTVTKLLIAILALVINTSVCAQIESMGWHDVVPYIPKIVGSKECKNYAQLKYSDATVDPFHISVGDVYWLSEYTFLEQANWAKDLIVDPNLAVAKRTFDLYDISELSKSDFDVIMGYVSHKNTMTGIFSKAEDGYLGVPVVWDNNFSQLISEVLANKKEIDDGNIIFATVAAEILNSAKYSITENLNLGRFDLGDELLNRVRWNYARKFAKDYDCGKLKDIEKAISGRIYVGFSEKIDTFNKKPNDTVITLSGAKGERLGSAIPIWPSPGIE